MNYPPKINRSLYLIAIVTMILLILGWAASATAAAPQDVITVSTTADIVANDQQCSLREAIRSANLDTAIGDGFGGECEAGNGTDVIMLPPGTYVLTTTGDGENSSNIGDLDILSSLSIIGADAATTIIDGNLSDRVLDVRPPDAGPLHQVTFSGITIQNGKTGTGGGIVNRGVLTLTNGTVVQDNESTSQHGGGIYNASGGTLIIENSSIVSNTAERNGGGIYNIDAASAVSVTSGSELSNNNAGLNGGGAFNRDGTLFIDASEVHSNTAQNLGGGLYVHNGGSLTVTGSSLLANAASDGGAVLQTTSTAAISDSCIVGNSGTAVEWRSGATIVATDNWWGDATGPSGEGGGTGDSISENVDAAPFLGAAILGCPVKNEPELSIAKLVSAESVASYETLTYTILITNSGLGSASGLNLMDTLPDGAIFESGSVVISPTAAGNASNAPQIASNLTVLPSSTVSLTYRAQYAIVGDQTVTNSVALSGDDLANPITATAGVDYIDQCSTPVPDLIVFSESDLAQGISTFNTTLRCGTFKIRFDDDISILDELPAINRTLPGLTLQIIGDGFSLSRGASGIRAFEIEQGSTVEITDLTIKNFYFSDGSSERDGAGIKNAGDLTIRDSTLENNQFEAKSPGLYRGGGIFNSGTLLLVNSTLSGNGSTSIFSSMRGGGLYSEGAAVIIHSSIIANHGGGSGPAGVYDNGDLTMFNSVIGSNSGATGTGATDCTSSNSAIISHSLIQDGSCGAQAGNSNGNLNGLPLLQALADNSGPSHTYLPNSNSPVIDAGDPAACEALDQRGKSRSADLNCDIGSVELRFSESATVTGAVVSGTVTTFGPTLASVEVTDDGGCLSSISVTRVESTPVNPTSTLEDRYWSIEPTGCTSGFSATLTLPSLMSDNNARLCFYDEPNMTWECDVTLVDGNNVTLAGLTHFSDWAIESGIATTAVTVQGKQIDAPVSVAGLVALLLMATGLFLIPSRISRRSDS